jgi:arginyl-tRNA synthetase
VSVPVDPARPESVFGAAIRDAVATVFGASIGDVPVSYPPSPVLGDLASPVCFDLARSLRRSPREIAERTVAALAGRGSIARFEAAGGYINAFFDRTSIVRASLGGPTARAEPTAGKVIVEHTNINPNKAAHIGHLRNAVLGDTLVRLLRRLGHRVEVQNYIDDTGVQVADLVVGFQTLRGEGLAEVRERYADERLRRRGERFDFVAWDLYAEVTRFYEVDAARLALRDAVLLAMEHGDNETAHLAAEIARRMVGHHLATMARIDVRYDLLPHESDILRLRFWDDAFARLRSSGAIRRVEDGKNTGCWVMDLAGVEEGAGEDQKVIVRSNGTVTYVGKDIAYQMWKFGLLDRDFGYRRFAGAPADAPYPVWTTCPSGGQADAPTFGHATVVYNVIDTRQAYLQRVVAQGLRALGHDAEADRSIHYSYEMVALTPAAVSRLFPDQPISTEDRARPYLEMSGRRGLGVRADDLLDALESAAAAEVRSRHPDLATDALTETARRISVGALRYYMLRFTRSRVVAFDLDAALSFDGETGPYLQYAVVRARNILAKVVERHGTDAAAPEALARTVDLAALDPESLAEHWNVVLGLVRADSVIEQAVQSLELSSVAKHAYALAQAFNSFYHRYPVAQEERPAVRDARVALVRVFHDGMMELLSALGVPVPDRM